MTDIWKEKPEPVWIPRGYSSKSKIKEDDVQMIILDDLDAWLEKLRGEHTLLTEHSGSAREAVKEFVLSRRKDIEQNIEDLGMLKPVLDFLEGESVEV